MHLCLTITKTNFPVAKQKQLNRYEVNFIEGFSQTGIFDLRDCNLQVASGKYRYPDEDYLTENNGSKWLYYDPAQYFRKLYPWTKVNLSQY